MLFFPLYQSAWITFVALGGIVTYQEYKSFTIYDALLFPLGMMITLTGVYMLMGRQSKYSRLAEDDPGKSPAYTEGVVEDGSDNISANSVDVAGLGEDVEAS